MSKEKEVVDVNDKTIELIKSLGEMGYRVVQLEDMDENYLSLVLDKNEVAD